MTEADPSRRQFQIRGGTRLCEFVLSDRNVDVIEGPLGSGKTHALFARLMRHAQQQRPSTLDGLRKSRWAVVRNSYPDLKRSTIRTWLELVPEHVYGRMNWSVPPSHRLRWADILVEIDFLALDKPEDIRKLRSTEYTGIVFNELQYIDKAIFDEAHSRLRYPPRSEGGATWRGIFGDANAPDEDHWLAIMTGQVDMPPGLTEAEAAVLAVWPEEWGFHLQPAALIEKMDPHGRVTGYDVNPTAENVENLEPDYYPKQIVGKTKAWIDSRLMVRVVLVVEGSPVWPNFKTETHVAHEVLRPHRAYDIDVGLDFGRSPAAVFGQGINSRILVLNELIGQNEGAVSFAPKVRAFIASQFPDHDLKRFRFWGDPKGADKTQVDDRTAYDVFSSFGMEVRGPPTLLQNKIEPRVDAVDSALTRMYDGKPCLMISPVCRTLKVGMAGRYFNEKDDHGELKPCKNRYSHVCFVAGTPISTPGGRVPIETLREGDMVQTPLGPRPVVAAMRRTAPVRRFRFSSGDLLCTIDHPFFTSYGFCPAEALRYRHIVGTEAKAWKFLFKLRRLMMAGPSGRSSPLAGGASIESRRAATTRIAGTSISTGLSGRQTTATSRWVTASTIATAILPTTIRQIWNACRVQITRAFTWPKLIDAPLLFPISRGRLSLLPSGAGNIPIERERLEWRARQVLSRASRWSKKNASRAFGAARNTEHTSTFASAGSARRPAKPPDGLPAGWMTRIASASFAALASAITAISRERPVRLLAVEKSSPEPVYNIEVADAHCYYAGGLLVSNCEALQYKILGMGEGRRMTGRPPIGEVRAVRVYRPKMMRRISA